MILRALRALWTYAVLCYGFGLLGVCGLIWSLLALPLRALLPVHRARPLGRRLIAGGFRSTSARCRLPAPSASSSRRWMPCAARGR